MGVEVPTPDASAQGTVVGTVRQLTRFPVKSSAGEEVPTAYVDTRGLAHDRTWAVYTADGGIASGKTTRRFRKVPGLMGWRSTMATGRGQGGDVPTLHSPDGEAFAADDPAVTNALSRTLGQAVTLQRETTVHHHDECGVHLVTTSSLRRVAELAGRDVDARRCRANIGLATAGVGFLEDDWTGGELAIGSEVVLRIGPGMPRCVMVDDAQADVPLGAPIMTVLGRSHGVLLGAQAHVVRTGWIAVGDVARLRQVAASG